MRARVAHFYGWTDQSISRMGYKEFLNYFNVIDVLEAQQDLRMIRAISYPHMKRPSQNKLYNELSRVIQRGVRKNNEKAHSVKDWAAQLAGRLHGK